MQWIEMIDWLYYGLSLIPFSWMAGAICLVAGDVPLALRAARIIIILAGAAAAVLVWLSNDVMLYLFSGTAAAGVLVLIDLIVGERLSRGGAPRRSMLSVIIISMVLGALIIPTGYNVTYPGMTLNMNRYAQVEGGNAGGGVDGVLVFDRPAVLADRLFGWLFPQYRFMPIPKDEPPLSDTFAQVIAMKIDANEIAAAIAMEKAGVGKGIIPDGVRIVAIVKGSPADGMLQAGDIVGALNGAPIQTVEAMIAYMEKSVKPGEPVEVALTRGAGRMNVKVPTKSSEQEPERAVFGISVETAVKLDTPRNVSFNEYIAHVGGPSHGAMLTLAFIDQLTEGGVTGGLSVAGTGTIEYDGSIGMVGGIPQKAYAVSRTEADVFFVPMEGEEAAKAAAPGLHVVGVGHIDDVLLWLKEHS